MPTPPKTIGRYDIIEMVGKGGMGVLYRGHDPKLERDVAVKMMHVDFTGDDTARERFQREARAVARLQHRNVVTIHELGDLDGTPYIVMEFLSGQDLEHILKSTTSTLPLVKKLDIAIQLCEGLGYAHDQGIVHRDIKPGNVRVLEDGTVKILDFGIAKFAMSSVTQSGTVMGTPSYMAPEQIMGQPVDGRADLFSTGVLLYELLAGKKPFVGDSPTSVVYQIMHGEAASIREIVPDLPDALAEVVSRALEKDPAQRYAKASELASDLQMVKMMLDLPLHPKERTGPQSTGDTTTIMPQLYATSRPKTPGTGPISGPVPETRMRPTAVAEAADVAARARKDEGAQPHVIYIVGGLVVGIALIFGYFAMNKGGAAPAGTDPATSRPGASAGAPAAANTSSGNIEVTSVPAGAAIALNGVDTGKVTPATLSIGGSGKSEITLALKGYKPLTAALTSDDVDAGKKNFRLGLEPQAVRLTVTSAFPVELVQGSKVISPAATKHEVTVQPGGANVSARNGELLLNQVVPIDFTRGRAEATIRAAGILAVFAQGALETCSVEVDGTDLGNPPISKKAVAAGSHTVQLKCADGKGDSRKVDITPGERSVVTFTPKG
ncbi:MAG TPA: serine/threonine-protein kinase [Vicinamibacterales bacterium]|nr:serine/threonine-protein kinase [Vicinamibacterales bacterium]